MADLQFQGYQPLFTNTTLDSRHLAVRRRKVHHKVKTGCKSCKARRQKCDEQKPICSGCTRYSTECFYLTQLHPQSRSQLFSIINAAGPGVIHDSLEPSLPRTPSSELNFDDLELMHQYITSTCISTTQRPEITSHAQTTTPRLAQAYPFVMRGILAMAATHLSRLRPSRHTHYAMLAAKNHSKAIPEFRIALKNMSRDNYHALIAFSKGLLWCAFARNELLAEVRSCHETANYDWLPQWFHLLRGSCHVVEAARTWIKDGPHVLYQFDGDSFDYTTSPYDQQITTLMSQLVPVVSLDTDLCEMVLLTLRESFARASMCHHNTPARNAINFWIGNLPDKFIDLLQHKEPWTLVTLAHFCVLVQQSEAVWFMEGHAKQMILTIIEYLHSSWTCYLRWPCSELGVDLDLLA